MASLNRMCPIRDPSSSTNEGWTTATAPSAARALTWSEEARQACSTRKRPSGYGGERLHRPLQAGVADGVHRDVEPSLDRGRHVVVDRRERVAGPDGGAVEPGVDQRFHAAVGEQLDRADSQPLVALPGGRPVAAGPRRARRTARPGAA